MPSRVQFSLSCRCSFSGQGSRGLLPPTCFGTFALEILSERRSPEECSRPRCPGGPSRSHLRRRVRVHRTSMGSLTPFVALCVSPVLRLPAFDLHDYHPGEVVDRPDLHPRKIAAPVPDLLRRHPGESDEGDLFGLGDAGLHRVPGLCHRRVRLAGSRTDDDEGAMLLDDDRPPVLLVQVRESRVCEPFPEEALIRVPATRLVRRPELAVEAQALRGRASSTTPSGCRIAVSFPPARRALESTPLACRPSRCLAPRSLRSARCAPIIAETFSGTPMRRLNVLGLALTAAWVLAIAVVLHLKAGEEVPP